MPKPKFRKGVIRGFDFTDAPDPTDDLRKVQLIKGTGPRVKKGQTIAVRYLGQAFDGDKPFDENFGDTGTGEPTTFSIGTGAVIKGWDKGLDGMPVGLPRGPGDPAGARLRRRGQPRQRHPEGRHAGLHDRHPRRGLASGVDPLRDGRIGGMTAGKSERLLNLLIMLLVQRHYVAKDRIREILYPDSTPDAFEKMFERDKDELRSLGVPIEVGQMDAFFDDEPGYRIRPDEFALPDISLTADEAAVIGLATKVWQHARLAEATTEAVRKLTALGVDVDLTALDIVEPRLSADEPSFDVFWEATQERTPVVFDYVRSGDTEVRTRHLQPWGVARYSGRWYVVGFDTDRRAERIFRLSRVQGTARQGRASRAPTRSRPAPT